MIDQKHDLGRWRRATVVSTTKAASNVMAIRFAVEGWREDGGHKPGQHVDVRLTSADGYMAERSYSIANPFPGDDFDVELGVELLENGEVSPYLWQLQPGEAIEMRGPIGGHFIWGTDMPDPLVLVAGGSGMVPLMSMLRLHESSAAKGADREVVFIISLRTIDKLLYADELAEISRRDARVRIAIALTESVPDGWTGYSRRIDAQMFEKEVGRLKGSMPDIYICGPTRFVEAAANLLVGLGFNTHSIRTERFGG
ncbi:MAG: oxidoreductase [Patescibacteria group bacterium]|nr:oxidoreductase [Patescibacteria group bacterium]MDE2116607.1 oxidoreductase [Patescibacteria group bacterium]